MVVDGLIIPVCQMAPSKDFQNLPANDIDLRASKYDRNEATIT